MDTTDASSCETKQISADIIIKNNNGIRNIHADDLFYLEQDLPFYQKVSLMFLLYADNRSEYKAILQKLLVLSVDQAKQTDLLRPWAKNTAEWKNILLEALCLMQANVIIHKLGLDCTELEQRFLPSNHYTSSYIHLIVKLLYFICEQLTTVQCKKLVNFMTNKYRSVRNILYSDKGEHLEIYLFHWLLEDVIDVGKSEKHGSDRISLPCNLEPIMQWLKEAELDSLMDTIKTVIGQFNAQMNPKPANNPSQMMQTDDKQATAVEEKLRSLESLQLQSTDPISAYQIRSKSAGIVLIVNQKSFHFDPNPKLKEFLPKRRLETRHGTDRDAEALQQVFKRFGYDVRLKNDRLHSEVLNDVRDVINESVRLDSVVVCILSHGHRGVVYGANSVPVNIEDIEKIVISDRLIGKPKILIVQACQGDETQRAKEIGYLSHDGPSNSLPTYSDFLSCISTVPGFTSIRHTQTGSWFIQTLCDKLKQFADQKHFVDILTVVCREVVDKRGRNNQCMVPRFHSSLRLDLYFPITK